MYKFEWDPAKNKANQKKHDISFEEAKSVFFDEDALEFYDFDHSHEETIKYFKELALETGLPYQNLINLYLRDCADQHRKLSMKWAS